MRNVYIIVILIGLVGCRNKVNKLDLPHLNGYWEIKEVTFPDGSKKEYTVNTSIDYIEVKEHEGFRKRYSQILMAPMLLPMMQNCLPYTKTKAFLT